ncbi:MAG: exodeoxyribonuclease VII small subunit [Gammaproteobacteria bacterium]|nr:exodeoxyribonuclease VII small subunit [Gammaproteobacteria bacterium]
MNKQASFETSLQELEQLVEKLEQGQLPLDESLKLYEQGMETARHCQQQLDQARLVLEKLGQQAALPTSPADEKSD